MSRDEKGNLVHPTAEVHDSVSLGGDTSIWNWAQVRSGAKIGSNCIISKGVYVDTDVVIGNFCKVQNNASIFVGVTIDDGVFIGPHVCFTNDMSPRAVNPDKSPKSADDWVISKTRVEEGAAIGANSTIVCGTTIGAWSLVGAGSVVTKDVAPHTLVVGNPAQVKGKVCRCGEIHSNLDQENCSACGRAL